MREAVADGMSGAAQRSSSASISAPPTPRSRTSIASARSRIVVDEIAQLVAPGELAPRPTLPSFLYLAGEHELPPDALRAAVGRDRSTDPSASSRATQGAAVPGRLVASAKSWLCHPRVDRLAPILPWGEAPDEPRGISPVEASARVSAPPGRRLAARRTGRALADEEVVLCVPASFDEVARELTRARGRRGGPAAVTLLEEPQAAFYAWLADHAADGAARRRRRRCWCATSAAAPPTSR